MDWVPTLGTGGGSKIAQKGSGSVDPDRAFGRYAQHGSEEDSARAADVESLMPNFVRIPRERTTFTPVEMQTGYDNRSKRREHWEVVA